MNKKILELNEFENYYTIRDLIEVKQNLGTSQLIAYEGYQGVEITVDENAITQKK